MSMRLLRRAILLLYWGSEDVQQMFIAEMRELSPITEKNRRRKLSPALRDRTDGGWVLPNIVIRHALFRRAEVTFDPVGEIYHISSQ